jgi:SpoU rRNA methylase family enzyme
LKLLCSFEQLFAFARVATKSIDLLVVSKTTKAAAQKIKAKAKAALLCLGFYPWFGFALPFEKQR